MKPLVFVGPSLHGVAIPSDADFDAAAPAGCGDILKAVRAGRTTIGLIDGTFETGPAIWHKEILFALASGCTVIGAASMGAIRAAECASCGMLGVGQIFEDFHSGRRHADADVAIVYGPRELGYLPVSVALVDVEDALARMHNACEIEADLRDRLLQQARATFFKQRSWNHLFLSVDAAPEAARRIKDWVAANGPGLKARDALLLVESLATLARYDRAPTRPFVDTVFFAKLRNADGGPEC